MPAPLPPTDGRRDAAWWDDRYRSGDVPWDRPGHAEPLERAVRRLGLRAGRALDLGCGRGRNAFWLAREGFSVVGVDISTEAIAAAEAAKGDLDCVFARLDVLEDPIEGGPFDLVLDFGCFHVFDTPEDRRALVEAVAAVVVPGAPWVAVIGSTDGPPREIGPPRRSAREVVEAVEPRFEVIELVRGVLSPDEEPERPIWQAVFRARPYSKSGAASARMRAK